jgi:hypothetical protein
MTLDRPLSNRIGPPHLSVTSESQLIAREIARAGLPLGRELPMEAIRRRGSPDGACNRRARKRIAMPGRDW